jgi:hypothetical protein
MQVDERWEEMVCVGEEARCWLLGMRCNYTKLVYSRRVRERDEEEKKDALNTNHDFARGKRLDPLGIWAVGCDAV